MQAAKSDSCRFFKQHGVISVEKIDSEIDFKMVGEEQILDLELKILLEKQNLNNSNEKLHLQKVKLIYHQQKYGVMQ